MCIDWNEKERKIRIKIRIKIKEEAKKEEERFESASWPLLSEWLRLSSLAGLAAVVAGRG